MKRVDKIKNALDDFIISRYFQKEIKLLRKKFNIPQNGFKFSQNVDRFCDNFDLIYFPKELLDKRNNLLEPLCVAIDKITEVFSINNQGVRNFFKIYLFHNKKMYKLINYELDLDKTGLCGVEDMKDNVQYFKNITDNTYLPLDIKDMFNAYPVAIKIHPDASQQDLIAYIKQNWRIISFYLDKYKNKNSKLGKTRTRNPEIQKRNDLIYKYKKQGKTIKQIRKLLAKKKIYLDDGYIGKIISREREKRH